MSDIDVAATRTGEGWTCEVRVRGAGETRHRVRVSDADLARLAPGATDPTELVGASFAFLLEREPKESILREFDVGVIARYFPEYEQAIRERPGRQPHGAR